MFFESRHGACCGGKVLEARTLCQLFSSLPKQTRCFGHAVQLIAQQLQPGAPRGCVAHHLHQQVGSRRVNWSRRVQDNDFTAPSYCKVLLDFRIHAGLCQSKGPAQQWLPQRQSLRQLSDLGECQASGHERYAHERPTRVGGKRVYAEREPIFLHQLVTILDLPVPIEWIFVRHNEG